MPLHLGAISLALFLSLQLTTVFAAEEEEGGGKKLMITKDMYSTTITYQDEKIEIVRNQDRSNLIDEYYSKTGRGTIAPMYPFGDAEVKTIGELEVIQSLQQREQGDQSILLIDSRTAGGYYRGTIPGSINIPFTEFGRNGSLDELLEDPFQVTSNGSKLDFSNAKTLVFFCNGAWCRQSITAIKRLLRTGYPENKIKYYRGGMQSWHSFGLTVVIPE